MSADSGIAHLAEVAIDLVAGRRRVTVGIAGAPGAGKSTLVEALLDAVVARRGVDWVAHVPMDGFHLADAQLDRLGARDRKGAPDTFDADGYTHLLRRLLEEPDTWIYAPGFERTLEQPIAAATVVPPSSRLVITEGNYLLLPETPWRAARANLAEVWFITGDEDLRRTRLIQRHVEFGKDQQAATSWVEQSDDANAKLVAATAARADRLVMANEHGWEFGQVPANTPPRRLM